MKLKDLPVCRLPEIAKEAELIPISQVAKKFGIDEDNIAILKNSINMVRDMGIRVVAVGVENLITRRRLIELNCMYQQGYYYSKPLEKREFVRFVLGITDMIGH